jgi:condensin complex subunit 1
LQDKQAESLKERLVGRLALGGPREWRTVAWCIGQLGYSEKGMRRIIELTPSYRHALAEQQVRMREVLWGKRSCKVL